jgi:hypothetical protein
MHDLLMESAFEPDLLVRRHWTHGDFGLCRFKSRQKRPARQLVLNFSAGMKFPGVRTAARAEPGLSARDQNAGIKQAALQYREVQHALEIGSLLQTSRRAATVLFEQAFNRDLFYECKHSFCI